MTRTSPRGWPPVTLGIAAGFLLLTALWFGVERDDGSMTAVFAGCAAAIFASAPALNRKGKGGG